MNGDGSSKTNVTNDPGSDRDPAWSPDGSKIAFVRADASSNYRILVMNADGSGQTPLTTTSYPLVDFGPDWQATQPPPCLVPKVVGRKLGAARAAIRRANCSLGRIRYARSARARGRVLRQSPRAGTRLRRGARVNLVVSRGRR